MKILISEKQYKRLGGLKNKEIGERARSFAHTRKKRLFPKSAIMANPARFKKYDRDVKGVSLNEHNHNNILEDLKSELASAAQKVYDEWEQNEEGYCDYLGFGGICQDIAEAMCDVLFRNNIECSTVSQQVGEQHVYTIAKIDEGVFEVDISPYTYETGGGYCWKKIPDVTITEDDISIRLLSDNPEDFETFMDY